MNVLNVSTQLSSSFHTQLASAKSDLEPWSFFSLMAKLSIEFSLARARATKREIQRPEARFFKGNQTFFCLPPVTTKYVIYFFYHYSFQAHYLHSQNTFNQDCASTAWNNPSGSLQLWFELATHQAQKQQNPQSGITDLCVNTTRQERKEM